MAELVCRKMKKIKYPTVEDVIKINKEVTEGALDLMRKPKPNHNKEILSLLEELWNKYPQMRLGQLLENFVFLDGERGDKTSQELYYQYDEKTIKRLKEVLLVKRE